MTPTPSIAQGLTVGDLLRRRTDASTPRRTVSNREVPSGVGARRRRGVMALRQPTPGDADR
jgi:hypothetical protein